MNRTLVEKTTECPIAISSKVMENAPVSHYLSALSHKLRTIISAFKNFSGGEIDEQRLTRRDPWLEAYRCRKDL